jgi:hypothetical protein
VEGQEEAHAEELALAVAVAAAGTAAGIVVETVEARHRTALEPVAAVASIVAVACIVVAANTAAVVGIAAVVAVAAVEEDIPGAFPSSVALGNLEARPCPCPSWDLVASYRRP